MQLSFTQAKKRFEETVKRMQNDLKAYAESGKATQRAVDTRLDIINQFIDCYEGFNNYLGWLEAENQRLLDLHNSTQSLVYWCQLHRVNPHGVWAYTTHELRELLYKGRRFGSPGDIVFKDDNFLRKFIDEKDSRIDPELFSFCDDPDTHNKETEKYLNTILIRCRTL